MAIEKHRVEPMEEIVFKNRNKEYGSYMLRKKYKRYVTISMLFGLFLLSVVVGYPLVNAYINKSKMIREKEKGSWRDHGKHETGRSTTTTTSSSSSRSFG